MPIIAVIQQKGGAGKSTIAGNLIAELIERKHSVLAFDLDPQRTLSRWAGEGEGLLRRRVTAMDVDESRHRLLRAAVEEALRAAEYVVLDTPPGFGPAAMSAALLTDIALVPVGPSPADLLASGDARELLREARRQRGSEKPVIAFVPSMTMRNTWSRELPSTLERFGERVFPGIVRRTAYLDAFAKGLTLREHLKGKGKGVTELDLLALAVEQTLGGPHVDCA